MDNVQQARIRRTRAFQDDPKAFVARIEADLDRFIAACNKQGYRPAVRLNATSDVAWWKYGFIHFYPNVQFYDYPKRPVHLWPDLPAYHRTFSHDPSNGWGPTQAALDAGHNVAVVFEVGKHDALPDTWADYPVLDGRTHDYRFLDPTGPHIVGLSALGYAKGSNFAITI